MSLRRFTRSVDGSIPIPALLYDDEELLASQEGVGIYDGTQKSPHHQAGTVHVSSHRLFYIDDRHEYTKSFAMDLSVVGQTDYYAGLFKSSAKITLHLAQPTNTSSTASTGVPGGSLEVYEPFESWECGICHERNPPGKSPAAARICRLCGMPRDSVPSSGSSLPSSSSLSTSLPSSSLHTAFSKSTPSIPIPPTSGPSSGRRPSAIACPTCTFLNHPSMRTCEMCSTDLPRIRNATGPDNAMTKSAPSTRPASPDPDDEDDGDSPPSRSIRLSFRKGGEKAFYAVLKRSLKTKAWQSSGIGVSKTLNKSQTRLDLGTSQSGISGILRTVESSAQDRVSGMSDALQDLEAFMVKAKDMVKLAAELNERLTASQSQASSTPSSTPGGAEPEEATFIRSSLSQLGLKMENTPVTLDMIKDERKWIEELARELARVLQDNGSGRGSGGLMKKRGIIALDEVWGGWNRARGVALIPPSTFLQVIPLLPIYTSPTISTRKLLSGLVVLHTPPFSQTAFAARLSSLLNLVGPKTTTEIVRELEVEDEVGTGVVEGGTVRQEGSRGTMTVALAAEMIAAVEADGFICRDDVGNVIGGAGGAGPGGGAGEVKWWKNVFEGYIWDGQVFE